MSSLNILNEHLFDFTNAESDLNRIAIENDIWQKFGKKGVVCITVNIYC